jgi:aspartate kinase
MSYNERLMIVMKFGGTSLESSEAIQQAAALIKERSKSSPLVVVSAMAGITNSLIALVKSIEEGDEEGIQAYIHEIEHRHHMVVTGLFKDSLKIGAGLKLLLEELRTFVNGLLIIREVSPRSYDKVVSFGERLSSFLLAKFLESTGFNNALLDSRELMVTDDQFTKAIPLVAETKKQVTALIPELLAKGVVPIVQGFIGATKSGLTTTLGRGGSDYSAAIFGVCLEAEQIEIWTDVDGMLTTDPRIVSEAKLIHEITFEEASELAYFGAKVLHPSTILPAIEKNIPVYVFNTKNPKSEGTKIAEKAPLEGAIRAIACKKGITIVTVNSSRMLLAHGFLRSIFEVFDRYKTSVDLVSTSEVNVSLTIDDIARLDEITEELKTFSEVTIEKERAIVCIVGEGMKQTPGVAARIFAAIPGININMISQGASEINLSFTVGEKDVEKVISKLHQEFFNK